MRTVAIIDNGIKTSRLKNCKSIKHYAITETYKLELCKESSIMSNTQTTHGTICAEIFDQYTLNPYNLISIKISDNTGLTNIKSLITAISWALSEGIDLLSISMGTTFYKDFPIIESLLCSFTDNHTIIVAAADNEGFLTAPAYFENVLGVKCNSEGTIQYEAITVLDDQIDGIDIIAVPSTDIPLSNSFSTPFIAAIVYNLMCTGIVNFTELKVKLKDDWRHVVAPSMNRVFDLEDTETMIDVPLIVLISDDITASVVCVADIVKSFRNIDYNCIGILLNQDANLSKGLISIKKHSDFSKCILPAIVKISHITLADIVIVHFSREEYEHLSDANRSLNLAVDIIIDSSHSSADVPANVYHIKSDDTKEIVKLLKFALV